LPNLALAVSSKFRRTAAAFSGDILARKLAEAGVTSVSVGGVVMWGASEAVLLRGRVVEAREAGAPVVGWGAP